MQRPLTIKEIQEKKKAEREKEINKVRITNLKSFQMVPIQLYGKNSKLAVNQISIQLGPKKNIDVPEYRLVMHQINNLRKRGMISICKVGSNISISEIKKNAVQKNNKSQVKNAKSNKKSKSVK